MSRRVKRDQFVGWVAVGAIVSLALIALGIVVIT